MVNATASLPAVDGQDVDDAFGVGVVVGGVAVAVVVGSSVGTAFVGVVGGVAVAVVASGGGVVGCVVSAAGLCVDAATAVESLTLAVADELGCVISVDDDGATVAAVVVIVV